jgi:uncharacterized protein YukE
MWSKFVDICGIVGLLIGIVGLIVTFRTFAEAKEAKRAAAKVYEAVWKRSAASDFKDMSQRARDLLGHVQNRQSDLATVRASDLLQAFQIAFGRWGRVLNNESVENLRLLQSQLEAISRSLSNDSIPTDAATYKKLSDRCHNLLSVLSTEAGRVELQAETQHHD